MSQTRIKTDPRAHTLVHTYGPSWWKRGCTSQALQARWCRRRYRRRSVTQIQSPSSTAASRRARVALGACHGAPLCPLQCAYARALKLPTKENYEHDGCYIQLYSSCDVKCGPHAKVGKPALWSGFPILVPEIIRLSCLQNQCQIYLKYIYYSC